MGHGAVGEYFFFYLQAYQILMDQGAVNNDGLFLGSKPSK